MFTLKTIVCGDISLRSEDAIQIAKAGSPGFKNIISKMAGYDNPDYAIEIPAVHGDAERSKVIQKDELIVRSRSDSANISDCIGIIITVSKSIITPDVDEYDGQMYEFIYKGDEAYITDSSGNTVEIIR